MNMRSLVATSTLVALLAIPLLGQSTYVTAPLADWAYFLGMTGGDAIAFAVAGSLVCASIAGVGALACGAVGVG